MSITRQTVQGLSDDELRIAMAEYQRRRRAVRQMSDEARRKQADYQRQYRKAHPEKVLRWNEEAVLRRAERIQQARANGGDRV